MKMLLLDFLFLKAFTISLKIFRKNLHMTYHERLTGTILDILAILVCIKN